MDMRVLLYNVAGFCDCPTASSHPATLNFVTGPSSDLLRQMGLPDLPAISTKTADHCVFGSYKLVANSWLGHYSIVDLLLYWSTSFPGDLDRSIQSIKVIISFEGV